MTRPNLSGMGTESLAALAAAGVSVRRPRGRAILAACGQFDLKKGATVPAPAQP